jgi:hypothetical protein
VREGGSRLPIVFKERLEGKRETVTYEGENILEKDSHILVVTVPAGIRWLLLWYNKRHLIFVSPLFFHFLLSKGSIVRGK